MRKIYLTLFAALTAVMAISGCKKEAPYYTAGEDDYPRILNSEFSKEGKTNSFQTIYRDEPFEFEIICTPAQYTTVTWYFNGVLTHTGNAVSTMLMAGDYQVKVVATTTKGLQTYRISNLTVLPLAGEPDLSRDGQPRWKEPSSDVMLKGTDLDGVKGAYIKVPTETKAEAWERMDVENFSNNGDNISFTLPSALGLGVYSLVLVMGSGAEYGGGKITVTYEPYGAIIWEGECEGINWGDCNIALDLDECKIEAGKKITVNYKLVDMPEGYHAAKVVTGPSWVSTVMPQVDGLSGSEYSFVVTKKVVENAKADGNQLLITGYGYVPLQILMCDATEEEIRKAEEGEDPTPDPTPTPGGDEITIWEGPSDPFAWSAVNIDNKEGIVEGTILRAYVTAEAGAMGGFATGSWMNLDDASVKWDAEHDPMSKQDLPEGEAVITWTMTTLDAMNEGGLAVVGNGFVLNKVTIENVSPYEGEIVWEGTSDKFAWSAVNIEKIEGIKVGTVLRAYVVADAGAMGGFATGSWMNLDDASVKWDAEHDPMSKQDLPEGEAVITWTMTSLDAMKEGGLAVVGNGFVLKAVTIENPEIVLWEGLSDKLAWGQVNIENKEGIEVGSVLKAYVTAEAGAMGGFATGSWMNLDDASVKWDAEHDPMSKQDLPEGEAVITWTMTTLDAMNEGGLAVVGNGIIVKKVVIAL